MMQGEWCTRMTATKRTCFVLMPFDEDRREIYDHAIRPAAEAADFECHRADDAFEIGAIIAKIIRNIFSSDVIVADISKLNPNVLYEVGVAHTVADKTIIICEKGQDLPFNLNAYRVLFYDKTFEGGITLKKQLTEVLRESIEWKPGPTNPVQDFRPVIYAVPLQEQAKLKAEIETLRREVQKLEKEKLRGELRNLMLALPNFQFRHLLNLISEHFYYEKRPIFLEELRKLRALGLVRNKEGTTIGGIPDKGDLKDYLEITDLARQVLEELLRLVGDKN